MPASVGDRQDLLTLRGRGTAAQEPHLLIGLINNMSAPSRQATERQFRNLIGSASAGIPTKFLVCVPSRPAIVTGETRALPADQFDLRELWDNQLDGLIVTGSEPAADSLTGEPNWNDLANLVDWAEENTHSVIWSCLAAHAAVYRLDGIPRRRLPNKLFGLFECTRHAGDRLADGLTSGLPDRFRVPHSRWNDVSEGMQVMTALGYRALTQSQSAGIDMFIRKRRSLFVFCQGHPEYEPDSLLLEYRRDIARFLRCERDSYPDAPREYFDHEAEAGLEIFRQRALSCRNERVLREFPISQLSQGMHGSWGGGAVRFYHNWLLYLSEQKAAAREKNGAGYVGEKTAQNSEPWKNLL
jgi:homoserine O-succinyltransferase/O-acetyltransferase